MLQLRSLSLVLISLVFVGCATTKPELSSQQYTDTAMDAIGMDSCNRNGWMDPNTTALGRRFLTTTLSRYTVDNDQLNSEIARLQANGTQPTQSDCNHLASLIHQRQNNILVNNQAVEYNQKTTQEFNNSTKVRNTYCNRIGTQTLCNTY